MVTANSVDPREVEYYTRFADLWWDKTGPFWPLHRLNEVRVPFILAEIRANLRLDPGVERPLDGVRILDIGCGGGILSESMAALGASVTGIDVVEKNIAVARLHAESSGLDIRFLELTAEALAAAGEQYDVVLNMEVVEHVADVEGFMRACCALVRPGGMMFVATINRTLAAMLIAIIGAEHVLRWMPKGTHRWDWFQKPEEIDRMLQAGGLAIRRMTGVGVNPLTKTLFLTRLDRVNYMLSALKGNP